MTTDVRDPRENDDDGFHEIQLSGKQLVFLCMATTVVSIVIFLCGVLVGRGVRPVEPVAEAASAMNEPIQQPETSLPPADASLRQPQDAGQPQAGQPQDEPTPVRDDAPAEERAATPPPAPATAKKPEAVKPEVGKPEVGKPEAAKPEAAKVEPPKTEAARPETAKPETAKPTPPPAPAAANTPAPAPASAPAAAKTGGAIAVQVGALRERADAEALARRLSGKGYAAYIVPPEGGAGGQVYKVRVGNYTSADEAARVKRRLEQEEKLKPWIIR